MVDIDSHPTVGFFICSTDLSSSFYALHLTSVVLGLIQREPVLPDECDRQPLIWYRWVRLEHTRIELARWDSGLARSYLDADLIAQQHDIRLGVATSISNIRGVVSWRGDDHKLCKQEVGIHVPQVNDKVR